MGITLNVWVFSGIIGVAYIMGYLMSRTMGRMLAAEGAEPEAAGRETAWYGRAEQREAAGAEERETAWPGRAGLRKAATQAGQRETARPGRAGLRKAAAQAGQREAARPGRAGLRKAAAQAKERESALPDRADLRELQAQFQREKAYAAGRRTQDREDGAGETREWQTGEWQKARVSRRYRSRAHREQQALPAGHPIASPVAGQVDILDSQGRRGVRFVPEENRVYAPASGKIIRLYPRGNEFLLRTDSGVVLRLQAGERDAEMTRDYFRPRVVQNEFVSKGKLLLEYDREALARDGYDTHVSMTVEENESSYDLSVTGCMWVKNGQDCLWVL